MKKENSKLIKEKLKLTKENLEIIEEINNKSQNYRTLVSANKKIDNLDMGEDCNIRRKKCYEQLKIDINLYKIIRNRDSEVDYDTNECYEEFRCNKNNYYEILMGKSQNYFEKCLAILIIINSFSTQDNELKHYNITYINDILYGIYGRRLRIYDKRENCIIDGIIHNERIAVINAKLEGQNERTIYY